MDLEILANRVVVIESDGLPWLCDVTRLLTDPRCFDIVTQKLVQSFEHFERKHSERYLSKVVSLGHIGWLMGTSVAAIGRRALVPLAGEESLRYDQGDPQYAYWSGNTRHLLRMPSGSLDASDVALLVVDTMMSGQTLLAATDFVKSTGAELLGILVLVEVQQLGGRARLEHAGCSVESILKLPLAQE